MNLQSPNILHEDNHLIVCVKPAGIATQSKSIKTPDMVSILKNHIAKSQKISAHSEPYLAVIHRLDQPVQGIMVFAKDVYKRQGIYIFIMLLRIYTLFCCHRIDKPLDCCSGSLDWSVKHPRHIFYGTRSGYNRYIRSAFLIASYKH